MAEIRGVVSGVRWTCPDGSGRVIASFSVTDSGERPDILGTDDSGVVQAGNSLLVVGDYREDEVRGRQFHATAFIRLQPRTQDGTLRYLREVAGLTDGQARKCWRRWCERSVEVARLQPEAMEAAGVVSIEDARRVAAALTADLRFQEARIGLATLFAGRRFPRGVIDACVRRWGERAPDVVRADPFVLLTLPDRPVGFARADALYVACGGAAARLKRQVLLLCWLVEENRDGHTWMRATDLKESLEGHEGIGKSRARVGDAIKVALRARRLVKHRDAHGDLWLTTPTMALAEAVVARRTREVLTHYAPLAAV